MPQIKEKEKRIHSSIYIPYTYYHCVLPEYPYVPLHWHPEFEISYVFKGTGEFRCDDQTFLADAGDIVIVLPNKLHSIYPVGDSDVVYDTVVFNESMISGTGEDRAYLECLSQFSMDDSYLPLPITKNHPDYSALKKSVIRIMECARENKAEKDLLLRLELLKVFWILIKNEDLHHRHDSFLSPMESIRSSIEYIRSHYENNISIEQLADISHLSQSYFMSMFKKATDISAIEYVNQVRVQAVCRKLIESELTVSQAAFSSGFNNLSNFNRQFVRFTGMTPWQYRKCAKVDQKDMPKIM